MSTAEGMKYILRMLNWAVVPDERVVFLYGLYQVPANLQIYVKQILRKLLLPPDTAAVPGGEWKARRQR